MLADLFLVIRRAFSSFGSHKVRSLSMGIRVIHPSLLLARIAKLQLLALLLMARNWSIMVLLKTSSQCNKKRHIKINMF